MSGVASVNFPVPATCVEADHVIEDKGGFHSTGDRYGIAMPLARAWHVRAGVRASEWVET